MPPAPKDTELKIERMLNAWSTLAPGKTFGGMSFGQFQETAQASL